MDEALALGEVVALVAGQLAGATAGALVEVDDQDILTLDLLQRLGIREPSAAYRNQQTSSQANLQKGPAGDSRFLVAR